MEKLGWLMRVVLLGVFCHTPGLLAPTLNLPNSPVIVVDADPPPAA
jgi:hypothetical protein